MRYQCTSLNTSGRQGSLSQPTNYQQGASPIMGEHGPMFLFLLFCKIFIGFVFLLAAIIVASHSDQIRIWVRYFIEEIHGLGPLCPVAFILTYIIVVVLFVPAEIMNIASGYIFTNFYGFHVGMVVAFVCSILGLLGGACLCFFISRNLLYVTINNCFRDSMLYRAFSCAVEEGGTTFVALIRLSPILPFTLTSYLFGVTPLKWKQLIIGSLSSVPLVFAFNFVGSALNDIDDIDFHHFHFTWKRAWWFLFGVAMAAVSLAYISVLTRKKLAEAYDRASYHGNQSQVLLERPTNMESVV